MRNRFPEHIPYIDYVGDLLYPPHATQQNFKSVKPAMDEASQPLESSLDATSQPQE
jgi:hypothetical protein